MSLGLMSTILPEYVQLLALETPPFSLMESMRPGHACWFVRIINLQIYPRASRFANTDVLSTLSTQVLASLVTCSTIPVLHSVLLLITATKQATELVLKSVHGRTSVKTALTVVAIILLQIKDSVFLLAPVAGLIM